MQKRTVDMERLQTTAAAPEFNEEAAAVAVLSVSTYEEEH